MPISRTTSLQNLHAPGDPSLAFRPVFSRQASPSNMLLCLGSEDEPPEGEFDKLPRSLRWRLKFAKRETDDRYGCDVVKTKHNRFVKKGCETTEYEALRFVDRHTSIPIPKVLGVYQTKEGVMVEYEIMAGRPLDTNWNNLTTSQKRKVVNDLGRFVDQLRKIDPPKRSVIGSATMGAAYDERFGNGKLGPFYSLESFHEYLRRGHPLEHFAEPELRRCHEKSYKLKFTHANLCPRNVLIDDSCRVCSILGWEHAGWYPEYWEYTQMHHVTPKTMSDWLEDMCKVMQRYDEELLADDVLRGRYSGSVYDSPRSIRAPSLTSSELAKEQKEIDDKNTESTSG